jgi:hypothetical protein
VSGPLPGAVQDLTAAHFRRIAPGFREVPGLIRKQFIYAEDGWAGGIYLWETREEAEAFYTGPWLDGIRERYGMTRRSSSSRQRASPTMRSRRSCCPMQPNSRSQAPAPVMAIDGPSSPRSG